MMTHCAEVRACYLSEGRKRGYERTDTLAAAATREGGKLMEIMPGRMTNLSWATPGMTPVN